MSIYRTGPKNKKLNRESVETGSLCIGRLGTFLRKEVSRLLDFASASSSSAPEVGERAIKAVVFIPVDTPGSV